MNDLCKNCNAKMSSAMLFCENCGTAKQASTPISAYIWAISIGAIIPIVAYLPVFASAFLPTTRDYRAGLAVVSVVLVFVFIPACLYFLARYQGSQWPSTSSWIWSLCVMAPLAIVLLIAGYIPGIVYILPGYFGAKAGKRRNQLSPRPSSINYR